MGLSYIIFSALSRASGGGLGAVPVRNWVERKLGKRAAGFVGHLPEILLSVIAASYTPYELLGQAISAAVIYVGWQLGHGTFYEMLGYRNQGKEGRTQTIELLPRPVSWRKPFGEWRDSTYGLRALFVRLGGDINSPLYSWVCMGVKGAIVGSPFGLVGVALMALLFPMAYWIGHRVEQVPSLSEWLAGLFFALVINNAQQVQ